jgi:hypothetical protein
MDIAPSIFHISKIPHLRVQVGKGFQHAVDAEFVEPCSWSYQTNHE